MVFTFNFNKKNKFVTTDPSACQTGCLELIITQKGFGLRTQACHETLEKGDTKTGWLPSASYVTLRKFCAGESVVE